MKAITISITDLVTQKRSTPVQEAHSTAGSTDHSICTEYLDPTLLDETAIESVKAFLDQGESKNTTRTYNSSMRYWHAWFGLRYGRPLSFPVPSTAVIQFIIDHLEHVHPDGYESYDLPEVIDQALVRLGVKARTGAQSLNTVLLRLAMLSTAHRTQKLKSPTQEDNVLELLRRIRAGFASRGIEPKSKPALTRDLLQKLLNTCDRSLEGIRDRAILLFAFSSGGRRRSEVTEARVSNLHAAEGNTYIYRMGRSKTDPTGQQLAACNLKPITGTAASAVAEWLAVSGITEGFLFRRIKMGKMTSERLSDDAVTYMVKKRAREAGLSGDFVAHSLRSGFVTEAGRQNVPLREVMAMTGHRSVNTVLRYFQPGAMQSSRAARVFD